MDIFISIISLLGFVLLTASTGLFVAIEFSLTGLERSTVDNDVSRRGDSKSRAVQRDFQNLSFVLSGAQLGITITTLATGYLAEPVLAKFFNPLCQTLGLSPETSSTVSLIAALLIATLLSMVFGELVPKNIAITNPLQTARMVVGPVNAFNQVFRGFINVLNKSANWVVRKIGIEPADELASARSAQELTALVKNSAEAGELEKNMAQVLDRSLKFGDATAEELMTPRSTVVALPEDDTVLDLINVALETGHSRFPVIDGDLDNTVGIVHYKDAFNIPPAERATTTVGSIARPINVIPESLDGDSVLNAVRNAGSQVVLVADEYGGIAGLITIEDVVEEILGEVYDEHDDAEAEKDFQKFGNSWAVSGLTRIDELKETLGYTAPEGPYETLGGLINYTLGAIPQAGDQMVLPQGEHTFSDSLDSRSDTRWLAKVTVMDDRRVDNAILTPISEKEAKEIISNKEQER